MRAPFLMEAPPRERVGRHQRIAGCAGRLGHRSPRGVEATGGRQVMEPNLSLPSSRPAVEAETGPDEGEFKRGRLEREERRWPGGIQKLAPMRQSTNPR